MSMGVTQATDVFWKSTVGFPALGRCVRSQWPISLYGEKQARRDVDEQVDGLTQKLSFVLLCGSVTSTVGCVTR